MVTSHVGQNIIIATVMVMVTVVGRRSMGRGCLDFGGKKFKIEIDSSIWREEIGNRNRPVICREEIGNRNRLVVVRVSRE